MEVFESRFKDFLYIEFFRIYWTVIFGEDKQPLDNCERPVDVNACHLSGGETVAARGVCKHVSRL